MSFAHRLFRGVCDDDATAIRAKIDPSEDPWVAGDDIHPAIVVLVIVNLLPCGAFVSRTEDALHTANLAAEEDSRVVAVRPDCGP